MYLKKPVNKYIKYGEVSLTSQRKLSEFSLHLLSGFFVGELVLTHYILEIEIPSYKVSGWHDVVVVNSLHEWLHLGSSLDFFLAHSLGYLQWVPINASH